MPASAKSCLQVLPQNMLCTHLVEESGYDPKCSSMRAAFMLLPTAGLTSRQELPCHSRSLKRVHTSREWPTHLACQIVLHCTMYTYRLDESRDAPASLVCTGSQAMRNHRTVLAMKVRSLTVLAISQTTLAFCSSTMLSNAAAVVACADSLSLPIP